MQVEELEKLSQKDLRLARNEIFARRGYIFESKDQQQYFSETSCYKPIATFSVNKLSATEIYNAHLIKSYEQDDYTKVLKTIIKDGIKFDLYNYACSSDNGLDNNLEANGYNPEDINYLVHINYTQTNLNHTSEEIQDLSNNTDYGLSTFDFSITNHEDTSFTPYDWAHSNYSMADLKPRVSLKQSLWHF